jgi:outer membrane protein
LFISLTIYCYSADVSKKQDKARRTEMSDKPLTLADCYRLALKQSEDIAIDADFVKEAEARFLQAFGTLLPHVSFTSTNTRERAPANAANSSNISSAPYKRAQRQFTVTQTIFSGFKEFAAMKGSNLERDQLINEKIRAEQLLLTDVSSAFYLLMQQKEDFNTVERIQAVLERRIIELKAREALGRSRHSEVVNTQAQLYSIKAQLELAKSRIVLARQLLEFLTGTSISDIVETQGGLPELGSQDAYLAKANSRPDVKATEKAWGVAKQRAYVTKTGLLPEVSVQGNYYTKRPELLQSTTWDALLTVNIPIFEGTEVYGMVKEANLKAKDAQLQFQRTKRQAYADIRDAYVNLRTAIIRTAALRKALQAAKLNYALQKKDYQLNLVNNLDVLSAIQTLENSRRDFIQTLYDTKRFFWQLQVAVGEIEMDN